MLKIILFFALIGFVIFEIAGLVKDIIKKKKEKGVQEND